MKKIPYDIATCCLVRKYKDIYPIMRLIVALGIIGQVMSVLDLPAVVVPHLMEWTEEDSSVSEPQKKLDKQLRKLKDYQIKSDELTAKHKQELIELKDKFKGSKLFDESQRILKENTKILIE